MTDRPHVSVILPTFNEAGNIALLIEEIDRALDGVSHEILVIDDRSPDGTAEVARRASERFPRTRVIEREPPPGLTVSILEGIERARGELVCWLDCDFSHPPEVLPRLLAPLDAGEADITAASRYVDGGSDERDDVLARAASLVITRLAWLLVDRRILDYTTGYVLGRRELILELGLRGDYGEYCIELLGEAVRRGHRVVEVPYRAVPRHAGESKTATSPLGFVRRGWRYLLTIARLWWRGLVGPTGSPPGREAGDARDRGEVGDTGDRGEAGDAGDRGEAGDAGDRGEAGDAGDAADAGEIRGRR